MKAEWVDRRRAGASLLSIAITFDPNLCADVAGPDSRSSSGSDFGGFKPMLKTIGIVAVAALTACAAAVLPGWVSTATGLQQHGYLFFASPAA